MNKKIVTQMLSQRAPPYVHYCKEVAEKSVTKILENFLPKLLLIEVDGRKTRDYKAFVEFCNNALGLSLGDDSHNHQPRLLWMRFDDLIATDINFRDYSGCVIFIRNAEQFLSSEKDGLILFGSAMVRAGYANVDPSNIEHNYIPELRSVHTVFLYNKMLQRAPHATAIKLFI